MVKLRKRCILLIIMFLITLGACGNNSNNKYNKNKNYKDYNSGSNNNNDRNDHNNGSNNNNDRNNHNNGSNNNNDRNDHNNDSNNNNDRNDHNNGSNNNVIKTGIDYGFLEGSDTVNKAIVTFNGSKITKIITEEYHIDLNRFGKLSNLDFLGKILGANHDSYIKLGSFLIYEFYAKYILIDDVLFIAEKINDFNLIYKTQENLTIEEFLNSPDNIEKYINAANNNLIYFVESKDDKSKYDQLKSNTKFLVTNTVNESSWKNSWRSNFSTLEFAEIDILKNFDNVNIDTWYYTEYVLEAGNVRIASPVEYLKLFKKAYFNAS